MSAPRMPTFILVMCLSLLVVGQQTGSALWYQPLANPMSNEAFKKVDQFIRARHATVLQGATIGQVESSTDGSTYRTSYTTSDGSVYATAVRQDGSSMSEVFWKKLQMPPINQPQAPVQTPHMMMTGGWSKSQVSENDAQFKLVDSFVREVKKQELQGARIINVSTQVVSGVNYKITYENNRGQAYVATVYRQAWTNTTTLSNFQKTVLPLGDSIVRGGPLIGSPQAARGVRVGGQRELTDFNDAMFVQAEKYVRGRYPKQLNNGKLVSVFEQVVAGKNYRMIFDSPTGKYEAVVWSQPWTKTLQVTRWTVLEKKGQAAQSVVVTQLPSQTFEQVANYNDDLGFNRIDRFVKQQNPFLANAQVVEVQKAAGEDNRYKIKYRTADRIYTIQATVQNAPLPNSRRMLQSAGAFYELTDYGNDGNFQSADRLTRRQKPDILGRADVVKVQRMDLPDAFNYRLTYRTDRGNASSVVYIQPSTRTVTLMNFESASIQATAPIAAAMPASVSVDSGNWQQLTSFSDLTLQRVDQLVRSRNPIIGSGTLSRMWLQGANTYRLLYTLQNGGTFQSVVTYNREDNSIFEIMKNESQKSTMIATTTSSVDADGFTNLLNFNTDGNFQLIDAYLRKNQNNLANAIVQSVRVQNGRLYRIIYRTRQGQQYNASADLQDVQNSSQGPVPVPVTTTTTTTTTTTYTTMTNYQTDPSFLFVDSALKSRYPGFASASIQSVEQLVNAGVITYKIRYLLLNRDLTEITSTFNPTSRSVDVVNLVQLGKGEAPVPVVPVIPVPVPVQTPVFVPTPVPTPPPVPVAQPVELQAPQRQGFTLISGFMDNPNVQRVLSMVRAKQAVSDMVLVGAWMKDSGTGLNIYRLRFRSPTGVIRQFDEVDVDQTPPQTSRVDSTEQRGNEKELINFQNDQNVLAIDREIRRTANFEKANIVKVWFSNTAQGLTQYTLRYYEPQTGYSQFKVQFSQEKGIMTNRPQVNFAERVPYITEDGYEMEANYGVNQVVRNADKYIRSINPQLAGSVIDIVWKKQLPEGTGIRILYVNRVTKVKTEVRVLARRGGNYELIQPSNQVAPTTTIKQTITTTTTKLERLSNFLSNPQFQFIDKYVKSTLGLSGAFPMSVWYETFDDGINYRINYIYDDGSLNEVNVTYTTSTKTPQIVGTPRELSGPSRRTNATTVRNITRTSNTTIWTTPPDLKQPTTPTPTPNPPTPAVPNGTKYFPGFTTTAQFVFNQTTVAKQPETPTPPPPPAPERPPTPGLIDWNSIIRQETRNVTTVNNTVIVPTPRPTPQPTPRPIQPTPTPPPPPPRVEPELPRVPTLPAGWFQLMNNKTTTTVNNNTSSSNLDIIVPRPSTPSFDIIAPRPTISTNTSTSTFTSTSNLVPTLSTTVVPTSSIFLLPNVPVISTVPTTSTTTISRQQEIDIDGPDSRRIDRFIRAQRDEIANHQILTVWRLIGSDSFRIIYVSLNEREPSYEIVVTRLPNDQLIINSITKTTSIVWSMGRFASFRDYQKDPQFTRVDRFCREVAQLGFSARVIDVWYQFLQNAINYRIQYQLWDGSVEEIIVSRQRNTDKLQIISRKTIVPKVSTSTSTTTTTTSSSSSSSTSTTPILTPVIPNPPVLNPAPKPSQGMQTLMTSWSTDKDFLTVDRFVRSQFPQLRNSQILSVVFIMQSGVMTYKIQYSGQTNQIVVQRALGSDRLSIVSQGLGKSGYQLYANYATDTEFSKVDAFARTQLPQLRNASIRNVWVEFISGNNYKIEYVTNQNVVIQVIIGWDRLTQSYVFQLVSPLNLLQFVVGKDPLCKVFKRNACLECSFRSYFDSNRRCKQVNPQCNAFNQSTGACLTCYSGYSVSNGDCVLTSQLLPPNCAQVSNADQCIRCSLGYTVNSQGKCIERMPGCQTFLPDGRCINCSIGYLMFEGTCRRQY